MSNSALLHDAVLWAGLRRSIRRGWVRALAGSVA